MDPPARLFMGTGTVPSWSALLAPEHLPALNSDKPSVLIKILIGNKDKSPTTSDEWLGGKQTGEEKEEPDSWTGEQ